jgi:hypothetical protein
LVNLLQDFHPKPVLVSVDEIGFLQATDCWIFLFNPVAKWCLLIGELSMLTFTVSIDKYVVIPSIYLTLLFKALIVCR